MLDYFKIREYQFLEELLEALWKFEGRGRARGTCHDLFTQDPAKMQERELGVLDEFVHWLWSRIVLDLSSIPVVEIDNRMACPLVSHILSKYQKSDIKLEARTARKSDFG